MTLLAIDTCFGACSAAVIDHGTALPAASGWQGTCLASRAEAMAVGQADRLLPMVGEVMAEARVSFPDLAALAVTYGPGTFTGVRTGIAAARGLALASGLPVLGLSSLALIAQGAIAELGRELAGARLAVCVDAGKGEVYVETFAADGRSDDAPLLMTAEQASMRWPLAPMVVVGSGGRAAVETAVRRGRTARACLPDIQPDARHVVGAQLAVLDPPRPLYLRQPDAKPVLLQGKETPQLRLARTEDAAHLSALHGQCFDTVWSEDMLAPVLSSPEATTLIAENHGQAGGFIQARAAADEAEILTLCVLPLLRRHGLGMLLLGGLIADLKSRGVKTLFLEVASSNLAAIGLYRAAGFSETGRRKAYYARAGAPAEDALIMALQL